MLSLLIFLVSVVISLACMPIRVHYQTSYCNANVAAVIDIKSEGQTSEELMRFSYYEGTLIELFKGQNLTVGTDIKVRSVGRLFSCRSPNLQSGKTYMILGYLQQDDVIEIAMHNGAVIISDKQQEKALRTRINSYDCQCKVRSVMPWLTTLVTQQPNECNAPSPYGCIWQEGACVNVNGICTYQHSCVIEPAALE